MCGIAGVIDLEGRPIPGLDRSLAVMNALLAHRGPDGSGTWIEGAGSEEAAGRETTGAVGLTHRRLSVIDLSAAASQPMAGEGELTLVFNGEIYNFQELRREWAGRWRFKGASDTETILAGYAARGDAVLERLRGMFAFALWDGRRRRLFCARDRFGIKPFFYAIQGGRLIFASEAKALLPFLDRVDTDPAALAEYLTFQYAIGEDTLFAGVRQLPPGHMLVAEAGRVSVQRYWDIAYDIDFDHSPSYFQRRLRELVDESIALHLRSDVPVGSHLSGGIDSSLVATLAARASATPIETFHGRFTSHPGYDESGYADIAAAAAGAKLWTLDITADDFQKHIRDVIRALDYPVAGPGAFPQYMVSQMAASRLKVVLGGQGGDEIFGGYARYLIAYFEQCVKAAIDGTYRDGNFVVTAESIIPNLGLLREYKPLLREFWREGLFEPLDRRYLRLIDQSRDIADEVHWEALPRERAAERFFEIFNCRANVRKEAYLDSMTHFDLKCLIPALLHVEDRMSMAHGLESRVPLLDHPLVEFAATVPADVKFRDGRMKHLLKTSFAAELPAPILERRDKMGFPVPLNEWFGGELRDWLHDVMGGSRARGRAYIDNERVLANLRRAGRFSRKMWGFLSLELWQQEFHDQADRYRAMLDEAPPPADAPPSA